MKLRIVTDKWCGYEVQVKRWWWPFWSQCSMSGRSTNTHPTIEKAEEYAARYRKENTKIKQKVVKDLG